MRVAHKLQLNNKKGFTLAELLVALGITVILLGISMLAIVNYTKAMKLTEMDSAAKQIFIASQNHLTAARASGSVDSLLSEEPAPGNGVLGGDIVDDYGSALPNDYDDSTFGDDETFSFDGYHYLVHEMGDEEILNNNFISYLLPFGAIDDNLRTAGSYIIEYNPANGDIYGVFYTDSFNLDRADVMSITRANGRFYNDAGEAVRRDYQDGVVGYYGGAMADGLLVKEIEEPIVQVDNGDILKINVTDPNYFQESGSGVNEILQTELRLTVTGLTSGETQEIVLPLTGTDENPEADTSQQEGSFEGNWSVEVVEVDGQQQLEYEVDFDDITETDGHFADLFTEFIPGEDISVVAVCTSNHVLTEVKKSEPAVTNSLFDSIIMGQTDTGVALNGSESVVATANLSCGRHIQNLEPRISYLPTATSNEFTQKLYIRYASVVENINWNDFVTETQTGSSNRITKSKKYTDITTTAFNAAVSQDGTYYPMFNAALRAFNGHGHTISNVVVRNTYNGSISGEANGGLFRALTPRDNSFTFSNLVLKNFDVDAIRNAGTLFGETINATANTLTIENVIVDGASVVSHSSGASAAGLGGYCDVATLLVDNCGSTVYARNDYDNNSNTTVSTAKAAGLIGQINGTNNTIQNCYVGGINAESLSPNIEVANGYAGGFIAATGGRAQLNMVNCYSVASVMGNYSGGLVGYRLGNLNATFTDCYVAGNVGHYAIKTGSSGAFLGNPGQSTVANNVFSGCTYLSDTGINAGKTAVGSMEDSVFGGNSNVRARTYQQMSNDFNSSPKAETLVSVDHYIGDVTLDRTLNGAQYPFKAVTRRVNVTNNSQYVGYIYYGDWPSEPEPELQIDGTHVVAYWERMSDGSEHWSTISLNYGQSPTYSDNLVTNPGNYVTAYRYMLLSKSSLLSIGDIGLGTFSFEQNIIGLVIRGTSIIGPDGEAWYAYYFRERTSDGSLRWQVSGTNGRSEWQYVVLNTGYGNSLEGGSNTNNLSYEIRAAQQLANIEDNLSDTYTQTCDIDLSGTTYSAPVVDGTFNGTYNGSSTTNPTGYSIVNFNQNITSGDYAGIFRRVGGSGYVSGINLQGTLTVNSSATERIGLLTGEAVGTIVNCHVVSNGDNESRITLTRVDNGAYIGLLIGNMSSGASVNRSSSVGTIVNTNANSDDVTVGGLVGRGTQSTINQSWSKVQILDYAAANRDNEFGGLLGAMQPNNNISSTVNNCYAVLGIVNSGTNSDERVGILIGNARGTKINYSHGAVMDENGQIIPETSGGVYSTYPLVTIGNENSISSSLRTAFTGCYTLANNTTLPTVVNLTLDQYKDLANFPLFNQSADGTLWEIRDNGQYPTLIDNKEPVI